MLRGRTPSAFSQFRILRFPSQTPVEVLARCMTAIPLYRISWRAALQKFFTGSNSRIGQLYQLELRWVAISVLPRHSPDRHGQGGATTPRKVTMTTSMTNIVDAQIWRMANRASPIITC